MTLKHQNFSFNYYKAFGINHHTSLPKEISATYTTTMETRSSKSKATQREIFVLKEIRELRELTVDAVGDLLPLLADPLLSLRLLSLRPSGGPCLGTRSVFGEHRPIIQVLQFFLHLRNTTIIYNKGFITMMEQRKSNSKNNRLCYTEVLGDTISVSINDSDLSTSLQYNVHQPLVKVTKWLKEEYLRPLAYLHTYTLDCKNLSVIFYLLYHGISH